MVHLFLFYYIPLSLPRKLEISLKAPCSTYVRTQSASFQLPKSIGCLVTWLIKQFYQGGSYHLPGLSVRQRSEFSPGSCGGSSPLLVEPNLPFSGKIVPSHVLHVQTTTQQIPSQKLYNLHRYTDNQKAPTAVSSCDEIIAYIQNTVLSYCHCRYNWSGLIALDKFVMHSTRYFPIAIIENTMTSSSLIA